MFVVSILLLKVVSSYSPKKRGLLNSSEGCCTFCYGHKIFNYKPFTLKVKNATKTSFEITFDNIFLFLNVIDQTLT